MNTKMAVGIVILLVLVAVAGVYLGSTYKLTPVTVPVVTPTPTQSLAPSPTIQPTATPTVDEKSVIISSVKAALVAEHGPDANSLDVTISTIQGDYAKGMASETGGGGIWFAAKVGGVWKLVFDGNGIIQCSQLTAYPNFPNTLIPECWDEATQKSITR